LNDIYGIDIIVCKLSGWR